VLKSKSRPTGKGGPNVKGIQEIEMADLRNKMSFSPEGSDTGGSFAFVEDDEEN
jgi:hypothetical protein